MHGMLVPGTRHRFREERLSWCRPQRQWAALAWCWLPLRGSCASPGPGAARPQLPPCPSLQGSCRRQRSPLPGPPAPCNWGVSCDHKVHPCPGVGGRPDALPWSSRALCAGGELAALGLFGSTGGPWGTAPAATPSRRLPCLWGPGHGTGAGAFRARLCGGASPELQDGAVSRPSSHQGAICWRSRGLRG